MPWRSQSEPTPVERVIAGLCYPSFGLVGLLYLILARPTSQSQFSRFHFVQSILLWVIGTLISWASQPMLGITMGLLEAVTPKESLIMVAQVIGWIITVLVNTFYLLLAYGAIWAFLGKFAEIPFISNIVRQNMRS